LHSTAITKLAPPENRQGHVNGAFVCFYLQRHPVTVSLLAAASCSSGKWQVLCTGKKEILFGSTEILVILMVGLYSLLWLMPPDE